MPKVTQPKEQIWTSKDSRSLKLMSYIFNQKAVNPANQELPVWCEACQLNLIPAGLSNWGVWWGGAGQGVWPAVWWDGLFYVWRSRRGSWKLS